jgi:hypothetical protein
LKSFGYLVGGVEITASVRDERIVRNMKYLDTQNHDKTQTVQPVDALMKLFFSLFRDHQSEYWVLYELICWLANCRGEVPSSEEISVVDSIIF